MSSREEHPDDLEPELRGLALARRKRIARGLAIILASAAVAGLVQLVTGCPTGTCAIWATPERAAAYGALVGVIIASL